MIFIYISLGLITLIFCVATYIAFSIFKPKIWDYQETYKFELDNKKFDEAYVKKFTIEDVYVTSKNIKLHGHMINQKGNQTVILMHGHSFSLYGSYKYMHIFLDRGFNVLMPNQRHHGLSGGKFTSLGYYESQDLNAWIELIKIKIPSTKILGVHGESMGGATVLLAGNHKDIDFMISDCAFSELKLQIKETLKHKFHLPSFMVYPTAWVTYLFFRIPFFKISPKDSVKHMDKPVLLIHGQDDWFVRVSHLEIIKNNFKNEPDTYVVPKAGHAGSYQKDPVMYEQTIDIFLKKHIKEHV
jgi:pimeloyl-ACP methyl ester carboxylesterase